MIPLDENTPEKQRRELESKRVHVRQIGEDIGRKGMQDEEIISLLHRMDRPTFFTMDADYYFRRWRHRAYCLVFLDIDDRSFAKYVRRVLRHPELNSKAKRMGCVIRIRPEGISLWRIHRQKEIHLEWS